MRKPMLEFLRWTLEFRRRNSNVQHRNSNVGIPTPTYLGIPRLGNRLISNVGILDDKQQILEVKI